MSIRPTVMYGVAVSEPRRAQKQLVVCPSPVGRTLSRNMALMVVLFPWLVRPTKTTWNTANGVHSWLSPCHEVPMSQVRGPTSVRPSHHSSKRHTFIESRDTMPPTPTIFSVKEAIKSTSSRVAATVASSRFDHEAGSWKTSPACRRIPANVWTRRESSLLAQANRFSGGKSFACVASSS